MTTLHDMLGRGVTPAQLGLTGSAADEMAGAGLVMLGPTGRWATCHSTEGK